MGNVAQQHFLEKHHGRTGKHRKNGEHLNLWNGCVTILYIDFQADSAFSEEVWRQKSKITAMRVFRP